MRDYARINRIMSIVLVATCAVVAVSLALFEWDWITGVNYTLHEVLGLPVMIGLVLVPIEVIAGVILFVLYLRDGYGRSVLNFILNIAAVVSLVICFLMVSLFTGGSSVSGFDDNIEKTELDGKYYVVFNNVSVELEKQMYEEITEGERYLYSYEKRTLFGKDYYKLNYLKPDYESQ